MEKKELKEMAELQERLNILRLKMNKENDKKEFEINKTYLNRYWKHQNSYSSGKNWTEYTRVISLNDSGVFTCVVVRTDSYENSKIEQDQYYRHMLEQYTEITKEEFDNIFNSTLELLKR